MQPFYLFYSYHKKKYINPNFYIMKKILITLLFVTGILQISCNSDAITNNPSTINPVDVYVAGSKDAKACYWKNGQVVLLDSGEFTESDVIKVIVSNGDVYAFGTGSINNSLTTVSYLFWKNGVVTNLKTSFGTNSHIVSSICDMEVIGNDVYFVGFMKPAFLTVELYDLVYWKNGIKTVINSNLNGSGATQIAVQNNDVYVTLSPTFNISLSGYYKNDVFYGNPDLRFDGLAAINNQVVVYGSNGFNPFYKNTVTNATTMVPFVNETTIINMVFDNNNLYYSNQSQVIKNGVLFNQSQLPNVISDFKIVNDNLYKIDSAVYGNPNDIQTVVVNNTIVLTRTSGEFFESLFVVQN